MRLNCLLVEVDLHLQNLAAIRRRHCGAVDGGELRADEILPEIEQLHLRQLLARQCELEDRHTRGVVTEHIRRRDSRRQQLENRLRRRRDLSKRRRDVDILPEENFDNAVTGQRLRFDVLNVGDLRGQIPFVEIDDAP